MPLEVIIRKDNTKQISAKMARAMAQSVKVQVQTMQRDVQGNIVKYDLIETGRMLGSVEGHLTGPLAGQVTVTAESDAGYPYPEAQNYGTRYMPASPFFSEAVTKAEQEFPNHVSVTVREAAG